MIAGASSKVKVRQSACSRQLQLQHSLTQPLELPKPCSSAVRASVFTGLALSAVARRVRRRQSARARATPLYRWAQTSDRDTLLRSEGAASYTWQWIDGVTVHYVLADSRKSDTDTAIVLMHGFGVASFHYESQFAALSQAGYKVYAPDNVGAGLSWPDYDPAPGGPDDLQNCPGAEWGFGSSPAAGFEELVIGERLWIRQITAFIEQCVSEKNVVLGGNSLGGYLATIATACMRKPLKDRIVGLALINPTPFWGWIPSKTKDLALHEALPWKGSFPIPDLVRPFALAWYNALRSPDSVQWLLNLVTHNPSGVGSKLPERISAMASHPAGAAAFAQILGTPQSDISFDQALEQLAEEEVPLLLLYGREDPWIVPYWASRALSCAPAAEYLQVSPSGHCPHFETPAAVNESLLQWLQSLQDKEQAAESRHSKFPSSLGDSFAMTESDGRLVTVTRRGSPQLVRDGEIVWDDIPGWLQNAVTGQ